MKYACLALWIGIELTAFPCLAEDWKPTTIPLTSRWTEEISAERVWPEYPRPQLVRSDWINLNGLWQYAIRPKDQVKPTQWDGKILVPYPVESALSGVGRFAQPDQKLWYRRNFASPMLVDSRRLLLNFGAVDWKLWCTSMASGSASTRADTCHFPSTSPITWRNDPTS